MKKWSDIQSYFLFPRHLAWPDPDVRALVEGLEAHWVGDGEVSVEGWFLPATADGARSSSDEAPLAQEGARPGCDRARPTADGRRPAVIFCHGNAELIDHWPLALRRYRELGMHVLLPEYRGYGRSGGRPSEREIVADLVRFHDWLAGHEAVDPARIVFHGRSLGGGIACALGRQRRPSALVLQSTFVSVPAVARRFGIPRALIRDRFESLAFVESYDGPLLVIHGENDELIPVSHAQRLHAAARYGELYLDHGDHNTTPTDNERYWCAIAAFLANLRPSDQP